MGKYLNLIGKRINLTLDAGGRELLEVPAGISEYDDEIAMKFSSILEKVEDEMEVELEEDLKEDKLEVEEVEVEVEKEETIEDLITLIDVV